MHEQQNKQTWCNQVKKNAQLRSLRTNFKTSVMILVNSHKNQVIWKLYIKLEYWSEVSSK